MTRAPIALLLTTLLSTAARAEPQDCHFVRPDDWFVLDDVLVETPPRVRLVRRSDERGQRGLGTRPVLRESDVALGMLVVRRIGPAPANRAGALAGSWELTRVVLRDGRKIYTAGLRETDDRRLRIVEGDDLRAAVQPGRPDLHGLGPEHWLIRSADPAATRPASFSAHVALRMTGSGDAYLDVVTGEIVHTRQAWRSRPLDPEEMRVGLRCARSEELPSRGAPDGTRRALGTPWTIGTIEEIAGGRAKLHGRWSGPEELRVVYFSHSAPPAWDDAGRH